ncbi:MAG: hypothetical protein IJW15_00015 [Clostridia bacterium]|nr:hypothetical protein [Clostridia bacterium]
MYVREQIFEIIKAYPGITDSELERKLNKRHQHINNECHTLENMGKIERKTNPLKNCIGNYPISTAPKSFWAVVIACLKKFLKRATDNAF